MVQNLNMYHANGKYFWYCVSVWNNVTELWERTAFPDYAKNVWSLFLSLSFCLCLSLAGILNFPQVHNITELMERTAFLDWMHEACYFLARTLNFSSLIDMMDLVSAYLCSNSSESFTISWTSLPRKETFVYLLHFAGLVSLAYRFLSSRLAFQVYICLINYVF